MKLNANSVKKRKSLVNWRNGCTNSPMRRRIAGSICGLLIVTVFIPSALAQTDYTYVFTANPGQVTWYNGTTIEIQVEPGGPNELPPPDLICDVVALDFHGVCDLPAWAGDPPYYGPSPASLTAFSFGNLPNVFSISEANAFGWSGAISGYGGGGPPQDPVSGIYELSSSVLFWGPGDGGTGQPVITEYATGTWSLVPDAGSSFELLAAAVAALGAGRLLLRGRRDYGKS
jgi:hypothetical protein